MKRKTTAESFWTRVESILSQYPGMPIVVLGKGASIDDIEPASLSNAFVVGINDAELFGHTDLSILHEAWVLERLQPHSPSLYLSSILPNSENCEVFVGDFAPTTEANSELMFQRLFSNSLVIEEVMFLTALRIAHFAWSRGTAPSVFLVGLDFAVDAGFGRSFDPAASGQSASMQRQKIEMQEGIFLKARDLLRTAGMEVHHVGYRPFSDLTPGAFSERLSSRFSARKRISPSAGQVLVTAEVTTNHLGDVDRAKKMIRLAHAAGANLVKFQMRDVETFYSSQILDGSYPSPFGTTFREYRNALELSDESFSQLATLADELGLAWFLSVLDRKSLDRAIALGASMLKVPGTMSRKRDFIREVVERFDGPLVFSTGMTHPEYTEWLLDLVGKERRVFLLHANSAYPTPTEDCNVRVVARYSQLLSHYPNITVGYSSHDEGWFGSVLAVALGAKMIEKHVKLGSSEAVHFDAVALDLETQEFSDYVSQIRKAEIALGDEEKRITSSEHHKY